MISCYENEIEMKDFNVKNEKTKESQKGEGQTRPYTR